MVNTKLVAGALIGLLLVAATFAETENASSADSYAEIVFVQGDDLLLLQANGRPISGDPLGLRLYPGCQVQTGAKTSVEIVAMPRHSRLRLSENTVVTIGRLEADGTTGLKLVYGRLRSKVEKLAGTSKPFTVSTSSYVAGVRGTDFGCDLLATRPGEPAAAKVYCFEGNVEVKPPENVVPPSAAEGPKAEAAQPEAVAASFAPILVSAGTMAVVTTGETEAAPNVEQKPIDVEIDSFWKSNDFTAIQPEDVSQAENPRGSAAPAFDLSPVREGLAAKNGVLGGALLMFASAVALDITSYAVRGHDSGTADSLLSGAAACAVIGLPLMVYSLAIDPLKATRAGR